ncbi:MAG: hypothetical protein ABI707_14785 [Ferruginibacter sp.]
MKKINRSLSLLLLLLSQLSMFAQVENEKNKKYEFVKNKSVSKSYNVSSNDKLTIHNSFGSVEVHTWNKNEIKVDIAIDVSSNKADFAQRLLDNIVISDDQKSNEISFKTSINNSNNSKNTKSTMSINYSISMPAGNPLDISNEFGATIIPDYSGEVNLISKFGSLTTGSLKNIKKIEVEFGKANFESIANGAVSVKYSKAEFNKLVGNIKLNFEFCGSTKINMDNSVTSLDLKASYSTVNLQPVGNPSATYSIFTSFGSFKNTTAIKFEDDDKEEDKGPKFDKNYEGKSGSGSIPVKATTSFGKIILGEASAEDMKEKGKSKSRTS